jgi:GntR family transcriptional regulator
VIRRKAAVVDRTSGLPAYRQVADDLRRKIASGEFAPGARLPSERELVDLFRVSRPTIRQAIGILRVEGLVLAEHGRGLFVRSTPALRRLTRSRLSRRERGESRGTFLTDAHVNRFTPRVEVTVRVEDADARTAGLLGIASGDAVTVRERVMFADDVPVQLAVSRLPRDVTRGTAVEEDDTGPGGIYARLEEGGHPLDHFTELVTARLPSSDEATALHLNPGTSVLAVTRVALTATGRAVEVNDMVLPGDRYELMYEIPADD